MGWLLVLVLTICFFCSKAVRTDEVYEKLEKRIQTAEKNIAEAKKQQNTNALLKELNEDKKTKTWLFDLGF